MPDTKLTLDDGLGLALIAVLALPILGAIICAMVRGARDARWVALVVSLICFVVTIPLLLNYRSLQPLSLGEISATHFNFNFHIGVDSISIWLLALTTFLMPLSIAASFASIKERPKEYYAWMLALQAAMTGVFIARDALLFYMFFIIGIWGGPQRRYAAGKFFLFTFTGSLFALAAIIYLGLQAHTFDINILIDHARSPLVSDHARLWLLLGLLIGFAVKVPLFPLHTWLPLAHTEAPTAGSVILAGVLLKLGTYGLYRFVIPMVPDAVVEYAPLIAVLSIIGIIYAALICWVQSDIKKLIAY